MEIGILLRVLIVDDEPFVRKGLAALIDWEAEGFHVEGEASNGKRAIELLKQQQYDLVICDIKMPEMDGLELIAYVRENHISDAKFVFLSGYYDFQYAKTAIQYACCDYILKPCQKEELLSCIRKIYGEYQRESLHAERLQTFGKAYLERHLLALIWGKYDGEDLDYVRKELKPADTIAFVHCEISLDDRRFAALSKEERKEQQRQLYIHASLLLKQNDYVIYNLMKYTECYNIGIVYCGFMSQEKGMSSEEWIQWLQEELTSHIGYQVAAYMGGEVKDISQIADSYREAILMRSLQAHNNENYRFNRAEAGQAGSLDKNHKAKLDELIHMIELNDTHKIREKAGEFYSSMMSSGTSMEAINSHMQYLLYGLLGIGYRYDADLNQQEIMQYIRETVFTPENKQEKRQKFQQFLLEYAEYIAQLRKNTARGVFASIEAEIEENYAENITLKSLGEKYYINCVYLGQVFKKKYGCSFKDYLNKVRIQKAAELLLNSEKQVGQVAAEVGYKSLDYFILKFEDTYGMTPLKFRKNR